MVSNAGGQKDVGIRTFALVSFLGMATAPIGIPFSLIGFGATVVLVLLINTRSILVDRSLEITRSAAFLIDVGLRLNAFCAPNNLLIGFRG